MIRPGLTIGTVICLCLAGEASNQGGASPVPSPLVERVQLPPDAADTDPRLADLRRRLLDAVATQDLDKLRTGLNPHFVRYTFFHETQGGPDTFIAAVRDNWTDDERDMLWRDIRDALRYPMSIGTASPDVAYAPYLGELQVTGEGWTFPRVFILADQVRLRERPSLEAPILELLSFEVVRSLGDDDRSSPVVVDGFPYAWQRVESVRGAKGWVLNRYAFGSGSFSMTLSLENGRWGIADLYRGDFH